MKKLFGLLFFFSAHVLAQTQSFSVYLVGDAGEHTAPDSNMLQLQQQLIQNPKSTTIFLGDNIYPEGLIEGKKNDKQSHEKISAQLKLFENYRGNLYYIPGNHDWCNATDFEKGKERLGAEEKFIQDFLRDSTSIKNKDNQTFLPSNGNCGPDQVALNNGKLKIIFIDSQWFLYLYYHRSPDSLQEIASKFWEHLFNELSEAKTQNQKVILVAHHPIFTNGNHSKQHRLLGFVKRLKYQDIDSKPMQAYRDKMLALLTLFPGAIYACGHDHGLQYFRGNGCDYIVSGAGSKVTPYSKHHDFNPHHPFNDVAHTMQKGFFRVDYLEDGGVEIWMMTKDGQPQKLN